MTIKSWETSGVHKQEACSSLSLLRIPACVKKCDLNRFFFEFMSDLYDNIG